MPLVTTSPEQAWNMLIGMFQMDADPRASVVGVLNFKEGSVTLTSPLGQPVKYWLAALVDPHGNYQNYLSADEEFGDVRIIVSQQPGPVDVSVSHWGNDSFALNGLNLEGRLFGPFKFHRP